MTNTAKTILIIAGILLVLYIIARVVFIRKVKTTIDGLNLKFTVNLTNQKEILIRTKKYLAGIILQEEIDKVFANLIQLDIKHTTAEKVVQFSYSSTMIKEITRITEESNLKSDLQFMSFKITLDELYHDFNSLIILYNKEIQLFNRQLNMFDGKIIAKLLGYRKGDLFK